MAEAPDQIRRTLDELVRPDARNRLLARGLARGMVWRDGLLPAEGPPFAESLTEELLDFGYGILALALELRDSNRTREAADRFATVDAFSVAAEAIESAVRRGADNSPDRGRHMVVGAAALHLAGYAARSYSLLPVPVLDQNLASPERALAFLLRRDIALLREHIVQWLGDARFSDATIAERLLREDDEFDVDDAALVSLTSTYYRGLGLFDTAVALGDQPLFDSARAALQQVVVNAAIVGNITLWWVATLSIHLADDLWNHSLHNRLPKSPSAADATRWDELRRDFIAVLAARHPPHLDLWPSQLEAASRAMDANDDLVIALPTSAGKTRIAEFCILRALADRKRVVYVTPLRALSAQIERVLARTFVPLDISVSALYGAVGATSIDTSTLENAEIVVATPEKLDFALRQDPAVLDDVGLVVFDEAHMIGLGRREVRYEVLIQRLLRRSDADGRRIVCLSAMFNPEDPYFQDFAKWLRADVEGNPVHVRWRPTRQRLATLAWNARAGAARLAFLEGEEAYVQRFFDARPPKGHRRKPFPADEIEFCIGAAAAFARDGHSVLLYSPQRSQVEPLVREFRRVYDQGNLPEILPPNAQHLAVALAVGREWLGNDHAAVAGLEIGVGTHHGALPRPFLSAVEKLLDARRLPVVVASPTLAQGVDLSCSVLVFRSLQRFDAETNTQVPISPAEFANVLGRAGRAYVDLDGISVLPTFEGGNYRARRHRVFNDLIKKSRGQRLVSGLAQLVWEISDRLSTQLSVSADKFVEYVLNQADLWADPRLGAQETADDDDEHGTLNEFLADLDVAILSLVEPLSIPVAELAATLDDILKSSLWKRTISRENAATQSREREVLVCWGRWVWITTTEVQRMACFSSGLGRQAGVFIYDRIDEFVEILAGMQKAIVANDDAATAVSAVAFAKLAMQEPFFSLRHTPADWEGILAAWIRGEGFSSILRGRKSRDAQQTQAFVQDGAVFRLVWAAEAVRAQAASTDHERGGELGDGPALSLTYGVPSIPAALLCQIGFASRVAALSAVRRRLGAFNDLDGMREWLQENDAIMKREDFWETVDHYILWNEVSPTRGTDVIKVWDRQEVDVVPQWSQNAPEPGARLRTIVRSGRTVVLCGDDLATLGRTELPFDAGHGALNAAVVSADVVRVSYFGPI